MAETIQLDVSLGLQQAIGQADRLREILKQSVKPDSSAYREIENLLNRATRQADMFKQTMNESLRTSSGTKRFATDLQKTFDILGAATDKLATLRGKDLIFDAHQTQVVQQMQADLAALSAQINQIKSGKIGTFFDDATIPQFRQIQDLAKKLNLDLQNTTFADLQKRISQELNKTNQDIDTTTQKLTDLEAVLNNLDITDVNRLTQGLKTKTAGSTVDVFKSENLQQARQKLAEFYRSDEFKMYTGQMKGNFGTGTPISEALAAEGHEIERTIANEIKRLDQLSEKLSNAYTQLRTVKVGQKGQDNKKKRAIIDKQQSLLQEIGFDALAEGENLNSYASRAAKAIHDYIESIPIKQAAFEPLRQQMLEGLQSVFEGLDTDQVVGGVRNFRQAISNMLVSQGVDIKDAGIAQALSEIKNNESANTVLQRVAAAVQLYTQNLQQSKAAIESQRQSLQMQRADLEAAAQATVDGAADQQHTLQLTQEQYDKLIELLEKYIHSVEEAHKGKVVNDPSLQQAEQQYRQLTAELQNYSNGLKQLESQQQALGNIKNAITNWMGFSQVLNLTRNAVQSMKNHIQELDQVMTQIAVVTNMTQEDLWNQIGTYSEIARQYGVAIKGVYQVSQIFYQQGLNTNEVMTLTTETLKMARIAGIDYATAADYMTTAVRGFKLEMADASHVTDVFSALAAKTASDTEELAVAISKTASSAEAVGSSFEATSAMIATMVSVTRESATNIGTALKSVISRYGEMTSDPSKLVDSEGEEMSLNRVDKALQSIGITLHNVNGQFRDFDDVILELADKWDTLDSLSQRYIATLMAGNRQQSRFLALVGNVQEYRNALQIAMNADNAGELQTIKTLDSLETKIERMRVTIQEFYTSSGLEALYKGIIDIITNVVNAMNQMPKLFQKIPIFAISVGVQIINSVKTLLAFIITNLQTTLEKARYATIAAVKKTNDEAAHEAYQGGVKIGQERARGERDGQKQTQSNVEMQTPVNGQQTSSRLRTGLGLGLNIAGSALTALSMNQYGNSRNEQDDYIAGGLSVAGTLASGIGQALTGNWAGLAITAITGVVNAYKMFNTTVERSLQLAEKRIEEAHQETVLRKGEADDLKTSLDKLKQLEEAQYSSNEAMEEYISYRNQLAEQYPELISHYTGEHDAVIDLADGYALLAQKRLAAAEASTAEAKERRERANKIADVASTALDKYNSQYNFLNDWGTENFNIFQGASFANQVISIADWLPSIFGVIKSSDVDDRIKANKMKASLDFAGVFSGAFDELPGFKQLKQNANAYKASASWDELIDTYNQILELIDSTGKEYSQTLQKNAEKTEIIATAHQGILKTLPDDIGAQFDQDRIFQEIIQSTVEHFQTLGSIYYDENQELMINSRYTISTVEEYFSQLTEAYYNQYNQLTESQQQALTAILGNRNNYSSAQEFENDIKKYLDTSDPLINILLLSELETYQANVEKVQTRIKNFADRNSNIKNIDIIQQYFDGVGAELPTNFASSIINIFERFKTFSENGLINYSDNLNNAFTDILEELWANDESVLQEFVSRFNALDWFDAEAVQDLANELKQDERYESDDDFKETVDALETYGQTLYYSLDAATESYLKRVKTRQEQIDKLYKARTSGVADADNLSEITQLLRASGYEGDLSEAFAYENGQFVLTAEAYGIARQGLTKKLEQDRVELENRVQEYEALLKEINPSLALDTNKYNSAQFKSLLMQYGVALDDEQKALIDNLVGTQELTVQEFIDLLSQASQDASDKIDLSEMVNTEVYRSAIRDALLSYISDQSKVNRQSLEDALRTYYQSLGIDDTLIEEAISDFIRKNLSGGVDAIKNLENVLQRPLTSEEIDSVYRADITQYLNALDNLTAVPGEIVDKTTMELLSASGAQFKQLSDEQFLVVQSAQELSTAYLQLYHTISSSGHATVTDLNTVYARYLESINNETDIVDALGDAAGMTWTRFGEILAQQGKRLEDFATSDYVKNIGGGKLRITDFAAFASDMGWDSNSEEYVSAFKTYNDSMIDLNRKTERNILEELNKATSAQPGDQVNLTQLYFKLSEDARTALALDLQAYGAELVNGILTLKDTANIPAISTLLMQQATEVVSLTETELAQLQESLDNFFTSLINAISTGLNGKLTRSGAADLQRQAQSLGITTPLSFTETAEGLKLSRDSAIQLYAALKNIDSIKASLLFEDTAKSLQEAGEECENISSTLAAIARLEAELQKPENANNQLLHDRLALYKEIAQSQAFDPKQFSFMDRAIPSGMQGPENYWNAVGDAYTAMNQAKSSGYMEIQDYYNIVTEMANLMEMSGGQLEWMGMNFANAAEMSATLIEQGMSALTNIDGKGVKISMAKLGQDFGIGVDDMSKGFDDGIKEMARAQIKMLDAQIALLEAVVAMEGLGDLDVDDVEGFSFGDVFKVDDEGFYVFTEQYDTWRQSVLDLATKNQDLAKALESVSFNGTTVRDMLAMNIDELDMTKEEAEQYFAAINSLYSMLQSGDYDLEDLIPSIQRVAAASHFEGEITVGDSTLLISHGFTLQKNENNQYTADGKTFNDFQEASRYLALKELGIQGNDINEIQGVDGTIDYEGTWQIGSATIKVKSDSKGVQYADEDGNYYPTVQQAIDANWAKYEQNYVPSENDLQLSREAWEIKQGYKVVLTPAETTSVTPEQAKALKDTTFADFQAAWNAAKGNDNQIYELEAKYGVKWTDDNSEEDFNQLQETVNGIESKSVSLNVTVTSDNAEFIDLLNAETPNKDITLTVTNVDYGPLTTSDPTQPNAAPKLNLTEASNSLTELKELITEITTIDWSNFETLSTILDAIVKKVTEIENAVKTFANQTFKVELNQTGTGTVNIDSTTDTSSIFDLVHTLDAAAQDVIDNLQNVIDALSTMETTADGLNKLADALTSITNTRTQLLTVAAVLTTFSSKIDSIRRSLDRIPSGTKNLAVRFNYSTSKSSAKGNVALAKGNGEALAKGVPTLMGELGPELVVSRGHYFVVGQAGAEFVNLEKDAIVFNHKQTKRLLENGSIGSRGVPFTNERNALSFAKGGLFGPARKVQVNNDTNVVYEAEGSKTTSTSTPNANYGKPVTTTKTIKETISGVRVSPTSHTLQLLSYAKGSMHGPAMASAQAALAQLKQIRAMWQSMLDASAKELGSLAGGSGGGKKGGGGNDWQQKTTTAEIQRWYNLIRQIAKLEEDISYQETLQSKLQSDRIANGKAMYKSYKDELAMLQQEIGANQELAALQKSWYDAKRADLAASDYGKIFTYDENGLQQYVGSGAPGSGLGLDILENLTRQDVYGQALDNAATAERQLAYLRSVGFNTENLKYNEDGTLIRTESLSGEELDNAYVQMMENFWTNLDGWRDELDSIYDSYHEQLENVLSNQNKQNEIFQKIIDNQLSVEEDVLKAIESREQKRIDDAQDERDAFSDSTDKFLKGLNDQLSKERDMYNRNGDQNDLERLQRQLAILMRSGGSASQIRNLQDQINAKTQDAYFNAQQDQINSIKEASDAQLERLDAQIDLMKETLEYQKDNGLLWAEVYEVMARTPAQIQDFIINNTPDFQSNSALQVAEDLRDLKLRIEQWTDYRDDVNGGNNPITTYANTWDTFYNATSELFGDLDPDTVANARNTYNQVLAETGDPNAAAMAADSILSKYRNMAWSNISNMSGAGTPTPSPYGDTYGSGGSGSNTLADKVSTIEATLKNGSKGDDVRKLQAALNKLGYTDNNNATLTEDGIFGSRTAEALKKFQREMGISADGILGPDTKAKFALKGYSGGGVVDYTGLAMVHGSATRPESFFDAEDTRLLKEDMMLRAQLMPSLLNTYNSIRNMNRLSNLTSDVASTTTIDHVDINLNIREMNNDYDARRAANTIMNEIVHISRQTGGIGLSRR